MRAMAFCLVLGALTGCAATLDVSGSEYHHMLSIDEDGDPVPMNVDGDRVSVDASGDEDEWDEALAKLELQVDSIIDRVEVELDEPEGLRILLVIHGGLISKEKALDHARATLAKMGCDEFYPIFVNWETDMMVSYADHLFSVRGGASQPLLAVPTSLFYFVADLGRALTRLPVTYVKQIYKAYLETFHSEDPVATPDLWGTARLDDSDVDVGILKKSGRIAQRVVPGAGRVVTTFGLDAIGKSAYSNMLRRARVLFLRDDDVGKKTRSQTGALSKLMNGLWGLDRNRRDPEVIEELEKGLRKLQRDVGRLRGEHADHALELNPECSSCGELLKRVEAARQGLFAASPLRITVIAHSMGTIVANELIRRNSGLVYDNIVYMGAACTIKDFADTTLVYVKEHPATTFYNLCLHPDVEQGERYAYGALPFGSLLVWIDSYITDRKSALDDTLGQWNNIARTLPVIDYLRSDVRRRIIVTGFGRGGDVPLSHGDFNDVHLKFWEPTFWDWRRSHTADPEDDDEPDDYECRHGAAQP